jgi:prepilin peptidase CpaA
VTDFANSGIVGVLGGSVFLVLLAIAVVSDVRVRRIPNRLVGIIALAGLGFTLLSSPTFVAIRDAVLAGVLGFGLWIPFYALRMIGAGDVKLFAAAGLWLVPVQVVDAAILAAVAGGVLSLIGIVTGYGGRLALLRFTYALRQPDSLLTPVNSESRRTLPYGAAMAVGLLVAGWMPRVFGS